MTDVLKYEGGNMADTDTPVTDDCNVGCTRCTTCLARAIADAWGEASKDEQRQVNVMVPLLAALLDTLTEEGGTNERTSQPDR